ncbi:hypothetical protein [Hymenobacter cheonanensis]|uniref:hypothetical protein n=1 Tax=Hymenobacter sp. CA2-7 TaxID=3063993 RepID=UPI00271309A4|nr:hypothetical protein [Hymenobacter sp. CA2-7]MDO7887206.1 hypothetical protein [Hymenobacter sp. CA2-7]
MNRQLRLLLLASCYFGLTSMAGCPNNVPAGQLTTVQGKVMNLRTGKPMTGIRMALATISQYPGSSGNYWNEADSTRTDLQGNYSFSFTNTYQLYYGVSCEGANDNTRIFRLDLPDSIITGYNPRSKRTIDLTIGSANTVNFKPSPRRVFAVQVLTRQTGYQYLSFNRLQKFPANNLSQTVYLYQSVPFYTGEAQNFYNRPGILPVATFSRTTASGATQDTLVSIKARTSLSGDTVRATLTFVR